MVRSLASFCNHDVPHLWNFLDIQGRCKTQETCLKASELGVHEELTLSDVDLRRLWVYKKMVLPLRWKPKCIIIETDYLELVSKMSLLYSCDFIVIVPLQTMGNSIFMSAISLYLDFATNASCRASFELSTKKSCASINPYLILNVAPNANDSEVRKAWIESMRVAQKQGNEALFSLYNSAYESIKNVWNRMKTNVEIQETKERIAKIYRRALRQGEVNPLWYYGNHSEASLSSENPPLRYNIHEKAMQQITWEIEAKETILSFFKWVETLNQKTTWNKLISDLGFDDVLLLIREAHVQTMIKFMQRQSHQTKEKKDLTILRLCLPHVGFKILNGNKLICDNNPRWIVDAKNVKILKRIKSEQTRIRNDQKTIKNKDHLKRK